MNYPVYEKSNEEIYKDYVDPNRKDWQNSNCYTLINRLNNGDMSALRTLRRIEVLRIMNSSFHSQPKSFLEIIKLYDRSNEDVFNDYLDPKREEFKVRDCNILIDRALHGDSEALDKLRLAGVDEITGNLTSRQATSALDEMKKS